jgi:predicted enzyme related to lactoylglutathione lyase
MRPENRIDYIEIPVSDPASARAFFEAMFGWEFQEWGPDYLSFSDGRFDGGICRSETPGLGRGVLLVFYSDDLDRDVARVTELGGTISKEIFEFPGGRRFQFLDPTGNEYAIWTDPAAEQK